jgi:hypothetical protein
VDRTDVREQWLVAHRELQHLRAAARCHSRRRLKRGELADRRRYEQARWDKLGSVRHLAPA